MLFFSNKNICRYHSIKHHETQTVWSISRRNRNPGWIITRIAFLATVHVVFLSAPWWWADSFTYPSQCIRYICTNVIFIINHTQNYSRVCVSIICKRFFCSVFKLPHCKVASKTGIENYWFAALDETIANKIILPKMG